MSVGMVFLFVSPNFLLPMFGVMVSFRAITDKRESNFTL